jgi:hypothetical protein
MQKFPILILCLLLFTNLAAQKNPNSKIGKKEAEATFFVLQDNVESAGFIKAQFGAQLVYRWPVRKYTKIGGGGSLTAEIGDYVGTSKNVFLYGTLFADITQFFGERQKWSASGQIGHVIYNDENEFETVYYQGFTKRTGGMYYSVSFSYRAIISKKTLFVVGPFWNLRNFRSRGVIEDYSFASTERFEKVEKHTGLGIKLGFIF